MIADINAKQPMFSDININYIGTALIAMNRSQIIKIYGKEYLIKYSTGRIKDVRIFNHIPFC